MSPIIIPFWERQNERVRLVNEGKREQRGTSKRTVRLTHPSTTSFLPPFSIYSLIFLAAHSGSYLWQECSTLSPQASARGLTVE
jgi:hypothetical protein